MSTTKPAGVSTLNLKSDGVRQWLNRNTVDSDSHSLHDDNNGIVKQLPPEIQPKSNQSNSTDTNTIKQSSLPLYSHSRSRTYVILHFTSNKYKKKGEILYLYYIHVCTSSLF